VERQTTAPAKETFLNSSDPLARFQGRLSLPLIAAPMFLVSGVDLVVAACHNGVIGAFPTVNCRSPDQLDDCSATSKAGCGVTPMKVESLRPRSART
jgi:hypothetical protein